MTRDREVALAIKQGCLLSEVLRVSKPRPTHDLRYAALLLADELEDYLQRQHGEPDWTPAAKAEVIAIIRRRMP